MKKRRYVLKPRVKIFILLMMIGYFCFIFIKQEIKLQQQLSEIEHLNQQIAQVEEENNELEQLMEYTESEDYIEKIARERLGWVKKGEIKFIEKKNK